MATRAYILIETSIGKSQDVVNTLEGIKEVNMLDVVTGPYDIIAVVTTDDISSIGDLVTNEIHAISGIMRTVSCISMDNWNTGTVNVSIQEIFSF